MSESQVFFYGLFMDPDVLRGEGIEAHDPRVAKVSGKALRIGKRATLVDDPQGEAHGVVMALSEPDREALYREESVAAYRPEPVSAITADGSALTAIAYVLPEADEGPANPEYARKLQAVAAKMGLPADYVDGIGRGPARCGVSQ